LKCVFHTQIAAQSKIAAHSKDFIHMKGNKPRKKYKPVMTEVSSWSLLDFGTFAQMLNGKGQGIKPNVLSALKIAINDAENFW
jgi:hypothetical protein